MQTSLATRLYACVLVALVSIAAARPASAQWQPKPKSNNEPVVGEDFRFVEGTAGLWWPSSNISIASSQFGFVGTTIDFRTDLGLTDQRFPEVSLLLRPAKAHKLRFQYIPINFTQSATPTRTIRFNGQNFDVSLPVNSVLNWKAYRFGYEFDFLQKRDWFAGFILEAKYTDVQASLTSPLASEFVHAQAPIPGIGGIGRYYVMSNIAVTAEITGLKVPTVQGRYGGHFADVDIYGTINFTPNVGTQIGYRAMDVGYLVKTDTGAMTLKGLYVAVVARY